MIPCCSLVHVCGGSPLLPQEAVLASLSVTVPCVSGLYWHTKSPSNLFSSWFIWCCTLAAINKHPQLHRAQGSESLPLSSAQITCSSEAQLAVTHLWCSCLFSLFAQLLLCTDFTHIFLQLWNHSTWQRCSFSFSLSVISSECSPYKVGPILKVFCSVLFSICFSCVFWLRKIKQRQILLLALTRATKQLIQERAFCMHKNTEILCFYQETKFEYMVLGSFTYLVWSKPKIQ